MTADDRCSIRGAPGRLFRRYSQAVFDFPYAVLCVTVVLLTIVPLCVLVVFPPFLDANPEKGFDTRDTPYSGPRLAWSQLQPWLLQGSRVIVDLGKANRTKRSWADDFLASFGSVACYEAPIPAMDYLAQFIIEVPDYEHLYSPKFVSDLCQLHQRIEGALRLFDNLTPYRNIWHISNYIACLAPGSRLNCSYLNPGDLPYARDVIESCLPYRKAIIECRKQCQTSFYQPQQALPNDDSTCGNCSAFGVPANCSSQMLFDLFYRILPKDIRARPLLINSFLPLYTYSSYRIQGYEVDITFFTRLEKALKKAIASSNDNYKLKGVLMDLKRDILLDAAISDSKYCLFAAILVFVLVLAYSQSIAYCFAVLWQLASSVITSAALYRAFSEEFPLLNLIVFVLLLAIGSDGAFLLLSMFPSSDELSFESFHACLRHTAATMFLTQFSTIVPFLLNILSSVIAFRNFGLFAGLTLISNYVLLISFLPAFLVIRSRFLRKCPKHTCFLQYYYSHVSDIVNSLIDDVLPSVLIEGRFFWIGSLCVVLVSAGFVSATQLRLPQYNPLQLFVSSNLHEFYDNNAEQLFHFVAPKIALPLTLRLVWGIEPSHSMSYFDPRQITPLVANRSFQLKTVDDVRALALDLHRMRELPFVEWNNKFWPERFLEWSRKLPCEADVVCCNVESAYYSDVYLDYCTRVSTSQIFTEYNDTPIYHNGTFELVGYTALLPTRLRYSHRFANLSTSFKMFDAYVHSPNMWYTTEWYLMSTWFDLQRSIISDCQYSVGISFVVVLIFAAIILRQLALLALLTIVCIVVSTSGAVVFLGWEIGVLEAVILVLVVGLSFDYTLHYGASVPKSGCPAHRIQASVQKATRAVALAALSSLAAGAVMLLSQTHAFFQVAVFLVVSTSLSFLFATFFFLPLLYVFLPSSKTPCSSCEKNRPHVLQLRVLSTSSYRC